MTNRKEDLSKSLESVLKKLQDPNTRLSSILVETLVIAKEAKEKNLETFCQNEIKGYPAPRQFELTKKNSDFAYRSMRCHISANEINIDFPHWAGDSKKLFEYFRSQQDHFPWFDWLITESISKVEKHASEVSSTTMAIHIVAPASMLNPNEPYFENRFIHSYFKPNAYDDLLQSIRAELTRKVLALYNKQKVTKEKKVSDTWVKIRLEKGEWDFNPQRQIGETGGFGEVFDGKSHENSKLAIKRLRIDAKNAGYRELSIAKFFSEKSFSHIMQVLDAGQDADSDRYYVVMPRADKSLQDEIDSDRLFNSDEAAAILLQIARGLKEAQDIVHRDIKPANILLHNGQWKIADFGIAKFVQEATSKQTLKEYKSDEYAAPEIWKGETATHASDLYSLGCIAYTLLSGFPPFKGADLRRQHLEDSPVRLTGLNPKLAGLVLTLLRKNQGGRPSVERAISVLESILFHTNATQLARSGRDALREANAHIVEDQLKKEAAAAKESEKHKGYDETRKQALSSLEDIVRNLFETIQEEADSAKVVEKPSSIHKTKAAISFGLARLSIVLERKEFLNAFFLERSKLNVLCIARIELIQENPRQVWGATLLFADKNNPLQFRWYEMSFFRFGEKASLTDAPFSCVDLEEIDRCLGMSHSLVLAFGPKSIDDEDMIEFCDRWAVLLAKASQGQLRPPRRFPLEGPPQNW